MSVLDTDVLIDYLRGLPEAMTWLDGSPSELFIVPGIAAMELLVGCANKQELTRTREFLRKFDVVWHEPREFARAYDLLAEHHPSSGLSILTALSQRWLWRGRFGCILSTGSTTR